MKTKQHKCFSRCFPRGFPGWLSAIALATLGVTGAIACRENAPAQLGEILTISTPTGAGTSPSLTLATDGRRAMAWMVMTDGKPTGQIAVRIDTTAPVILTDSLGAAQAHAEAPPQVSFGPDGSLYVLYVLARDVGRRFPISALRILRSNDGGATWDPPMTVTDDTAVFGAHNFHSLHVADDGTVYAAWLDGRNGKAATYMTSSRDGGRTWAPNTQVSVDTSCPCCRTAIAAGPDGLVYVAWRTVFPGDVRDIVVARSNDYGATWNPPERVHADGWVYAGCPHAGPSIRLDASGRLHALWWTGKPGKGGVFYATSTDQGKTFSPPQAIDSQPVPTPTHVQLAVGTGGRILAVWDELQTDPSTIALRMSADHGQTFQAPVIVSDGSHPAKHPVIGFRDRTAYVAWVRHGNTTDVMMRTVDVPPVDAHR